MTNNNSSGRGMKGGTVRASLKLETKSSCYCNLGTSASNSAVDTEGSLISKLNALAEQDSQEGAIEMEQQQRQEGEFNNEMEEEALKLFALELYVENSDGMAGGLNEEDIAALEVEEAFPSSNKTVQGKEGSTLPEVPTVNIIKGVPSTSIWTVWDGGTVSPTTSAKRSSSQKQKEVATGQSSPQSLVELSESFVSLYPSFLADAMNVAELSNLKSKVASRSLSDKSFDVNIRMHSLRDMNRATQVNLVPFSPKDWQVLDSLEEGRTKILQETWVQRVARVGVVGGAFYVNTSGGGGNSSKGSVKLKIESIECVTPNGKTNQISIKESDMNSGNYLYGINRAFYMDGGTLVVIAPKLYPLSKKDAKDSEEDPDGIYNGRVIISKDDDTHFSILPDQVNECGEIIYIQSTDYDAIFGTSDGKRSCFGYASKLFKGKAKGNGSVWTLGPQMARDIGVQDYSRVRLQSLSKGSNTRMSVGECDVIVSFQKNADVVETDPDIVENLRKYFAVLLAPSPTPIDDGTGNVNSVNELLLWDGMILSNFENVGEVSLSIQVSEWSQSEGEEKRKLEWFDMPRHVLLQSLEDVDSLHIKFAPDNSATRKKMNSDKQVEEGREVVEMPGYDSLLSRWQELLSTFHRLYTLTTFGSVKKVGGLIIVGPSGSGKSTALQHLAQNFSLNEKSFVLNVSCLDLEHLTKTEGGVKKVQGSLQKIIEKCIWQRPTLLCLDDLHLLVGDTTPPQGQPLTTMTANAIASLLVMDFLEELERKSILFIATSLHPLKSLDPLLAKKHIFGDILLLPATPDKAQRNEVLNSLYQTLECGVEMELIQGNDEVEGIKSYCLADLVGVWGGALQCRRERISKGRRNGKVEDIEECLKKIDLVQAVGRYKSLSQSLANVNSSSSNNELETGISKWESIGGLKDTKEMLLQTMKWPSIYPQIFKSSPLRLRSGVLLYGYPGCGKTLLASALAQACGDGMSFISVKGPEVLNKYIGESERGVRDLFVRARATQPCILFFDEFESIAPQRGHENTGVTDRVVNQLLTELDGAEGLGEGVYILAATSRPDLIDPALLRPGRIDKAVKVDMPTFEERMEIARKITEESIEVDKTTVDWWNLCGDERMAGFSGADIQGVLYSAQLLAIHERMERTKMGGSLIQNQDSTSSTSERNFTILPNPVDRLTNSIVNLDKIGSIVSSTIQKEVEVYRKNTETRNAPFMKEVKGKTSVNHDENKKIQVEGKHILESLKTSRASIQRQEYYRLEHIYRNFSGEESPNLNAKSVGGGGGGGGNSSSSKGKGKQKMVMAGDDNDDDEFEGGGAKFGERAGFK